jgi:riboflavin kinase/FMN adenylyltransferase
MDRLMNIWNGIGSYPRSAAAACASIGNYDGVHRGHRAILDRVVERARHEGSPSLLVTFSPHPVYVVAPDRAPKLLQTREQNLESLRDTGLTDVLILDFDEDLAALTGEDFFTRMLGDRVKLSAVLVGENFRFGRGREGDLDLLREIGSRQGFEVLGVAPVQNEGRVVSSSAIRKQIAEGDVASAHTMLGRPYEIAGEVLQGDGRGRTLGFPTANVESANEIVPAHGVYVTETLALAGRFPSVTNVGMRPTIDGVDLRVETHLLGFDEDLYGERVTVRFLAHLRDETQFNDVTELADQIARDRAAAESYFQNQPLTLP